MSIIDGKVITFDELALVPTRTKYLDAEKIKSCRATMLARAPLEFLPVHIWESYLPEKAGQLVIDKYSVRMYKIVMAGIVKSGEKVTVVLDGVLPYFELRVQGAAAEFQARVQAACQEQKFKLRECRVVTGATIQQYGDRAEFLQLSFTSLGERKKALEYFDQAKTATGAPYELTHDDTTCYYRMVSRDTLTPWTSWCTLQDYRVTSRHPFFRTRSTIEVDHRKIRAYAGDMFADEALREDRTIECLWDIETHDPEEAEIPQPLSKSFDMPNISMSFAFIDAALCPVNACAPGDARYSWTRPRGHIAQFNITTMMTAAMPNRTTVMCRDRREQIMAFAMIWKKMQPDYEIEFNGHRYDWWCVVEQARQLDLLEFMELAMSITDLALYRQIEDRTFTSPKTAFTDPALGAEARSWAGYTHWKKYQFKISAELQNFPAACLNYPGYVCIDLLPQLRALCGNPEKYSLHKFLEMFQLGDKVDMPYREMFARFAGNRALLAQLQQGSDPPANLGSEAVLASAERHVAQPVVYKRYTLGRDVRVEAGEVRAYNMRYTLGPHVHQVGAQIVIAYATMLEAVTVAMREMMEVAEYCVVDGLRCHDLLVKTQYIRDKRQVGVLSFTSFDDCVYRANGMKVRQMIIAKAQSRAYHVSNRAPKKVEVGKYPGAYVFPPKKGVATSKPSPAELRRSDAEAHREWRDMTAATFERVLARIRERGANVADYTESDLEGMPPAFREWLAQDTHYPIAGLDFSSLYPSLIMTYNFSPEMMVHSLERALELAAEGKQIHPVNFPFNGRTIKGWSVRHRYATRQAEIDGVITQLLRTTRAEDPDSSREQRLAAELERLLCASEFGLFPTVLKDLFDQRVGLKAQLKPLTHRKEEIELMTAEAFTQHAPEYAQVLGKWNYLNSKQKALKVFMNTFYGESGNAMSPLRVLALAGGVTTGGQYNIKKVAQLVQDLGCRIYYGDTDSVYISMPRAAFAQADREYYSVPLREFSEASKVAYWAALVTESFRQIKIINRAVNEALEADNGTKFLNMAFEEFLYPAAFFSKKKYCGIAHEGAYNANPKSIFVRGLEYVKKGVSDMLRDISKDILWQTFAPGNLIGIDRIVEQTIERIYRERNIDFEKFIMTASYKPNKQNVKVHTFYRRMDALGLAPEPLDRFRYVMVKKYPFKYDLRGKKTALSVGDRMEYVERAQQLNMEIDLDYYMGASVCGQLARFISWREDFHVAPRDDSDEAYNDAEKKNIAAAQKYIERCYERWSDKHQSQGPALRTLYKKVNGVFHEEFSRIIRVSDLWQFENDDENQTLYQRIIEKIDKQVQRDCRRDAERIIAGMTLQDVATAATKRTCYRELAASRRLRASQLLPGLNQRLRDNIQKLRKLFTKRDNILEQCISRLSGAVGIDRENFDTLELIRANIEKLDTSALRERINGEIGLRVTHGDLMVLNEIDSVYLKILSVQKVVRVTEMVLDELGNYLHYKLGAPVRADIEDLDEWMQDNID